MAEGLFSFLYILFKWNTFSYFDSGVHSYTITAADRRAIINLENLFVVFHMGLYVGYLYLWISWWLVLVPIMQGGAKAFGELQLTDSDIPMNGILKWNFQVLLCHKYASNGICDFVYPPTFTLFCELNYYLVGGC